MPYLPSQIVSITQCRGCGASGLDVLHNFGPQRLVEFPSSPGGCQKPPAPIVLLRCRSCTLVQLEHTVPAEWRYTEYWYRSGTNEVMRAELRDIVQQARQRVPISPKSVVVDIGANDGTLLGLWMDTADTQHGCPYRIAVEPATNLYEEARQHAEELYSVCWPSPELSGLQRRSVSVLTSIAMVYGADQLNAFVAEIARVLKDDGLWIVQFQDLGSGLRTTAVDYLVHEHLVWFSAYSFAQLLEPFGLRLLDLEHRTINGGSLRCYVGRKGYSSGMVNHAILQEAETGVHRGLEDALSPWPWFLRRVHQIRESVPQTLQAVQAQGGVVDLYACSTKATLLLQLCGVDHTLIRQGVERQAQKWGRYVGATGIPIVSEEAWRKDPPPLTLLGAYQFVDAFLQRERAYLEAGGQFLVPIPTPTIVAQQRVA